ncbi:MAG: hypothetical protein Q7V62_13505, partial [Actinomycetota bacterium]|nr:hypothetical protein [Actinomycetota bacterium]
MTRRPTPRRPRAGTDDGSSLVIVLAFILIGALFITPMMQYAVAVTRAGSSQQDKIVRAEAVKGAFRTAMSDPKKLYEACSGSGLNEEVTLASAGLDIGVTTQCTTVKYALELD